MRGGSPRTLARLGAGVAALGLVVLSASPASAATGQITSATPTPDGHFQLVFQANGLAAGESIDPASVQVSIDGQNVQGVTAKPIGETTAPDRLTMLVVDTSGSMATGTTADGVNRLTAAKQAATSYLDAAPPDVKVGLVTFGDTAVVNTAPTSDRAALKRAVQALTATGNTALYDAVALATQKLGAAPSIRSELLISDGEDTLSRASLPTATAAVKKAGVQLDAVSLGATTVAPPALAALAAAGGGKVIPTNQASQLAAAFTSAAAAQATAVVIDVPVPPSVAGTSKTVVVAATAGGQTVGANGFYILPAAVTGVPTSAAASYGPVPVETPSAGITGQPWFLPVAVAAVGLGLFGLLAIAFVSTDRENQTTGRVRRRLSRYSLTSRQEKQSTVATSGALGQSQVARSAVEFAGRVTQNRDVDTVLGAKLDAAGIPLKPPEWMLVHVGIAILAALVMALLTGFGVVATLMGLGLGLLLPFVYLSMKEGRRKSAFAAQLPSTLQLLSGSLAAGYSLPQAVDTVVRESSGPMAAELNRAIVEARLGVPMEDALETVAKRMNSVDFAWVVMAIRIQREVGGNLAEVLSSVAATMRERERLRRQVEVLSAEGRLSAIILGALPLLFVLYLVLVRPEYIGVLITNPLGIAMIVVGVVLLVAGGFWLRKVVAVEV